MLINRAFFSLFVEQICLWTEPRYGNRVRYLSTSSCQRSVIPGFSATVAVRYKVYKSVIACNLRCSIIGLFSSCVVGYGSRSQRYTCWQCSRRIIVGHKLEEIIICSNLFIYLTYLSYYDSVGRLAGWDIASYNLECEDETKITHPFTVSTEGKVTITIKGLLFARCKFLPQNRTRTNCHLTDSSPRQAEQTNDGEGGNRSTCFE